MPGPGRTARPPRDYGRRREPSLTLVLLGPQPESRVDDPGARAPADDRAADNVRRLRAIPPDQVHLGRERPRLAPLVRRPREACARRKDVVRDAAVARADRLLLPQ